MPKKDEQVQDEQVQDAGTQQVQDALTQEQEQGYRGAKVDPTPNSAYSVAGVTSGEPTPETDPVAAKEAREAVSGG